MMTRAWCACGQFGSQEQPKQLLAVLGHRRHKKHPGCMEPPYILGADGGAERADYPAKGSPAAAQPALPPQRSAHDPVVRPTAPLREAPATAGAGSTAQGGSQPEQHSAPRGYAPYDEPDFGPLAPPVEPPTPPSMGKAAVPAPDPKTPYLPPAPMFTMTVKISAGMAQLWDYSTQQGYTGDFDSWLDQAVKMCFRDLFGVAAVIAPVEQLV